MLTIKVPESEGFDEEASKFIYYDAVVLELEHSLVSLSKWEELYEKPFLSGQQMTSEEALSYIRLMNLTPDVPEDVWESRLTEENLREIDSYINRKMTATTFRDLLGNSRSNELITAELIYYWMHTLNIPLEFQEMHLGKLFTVIRVHSVKSQKPKKRSSAEIAEEQYRLNEQRRAQYETNG